MAYTRRRAADSLKEHLAKHGRSYDFFQAVEMLEYLYPENGKVGYDSVPTKESVRFEPDASFGFSPSEITGIEVQDQSLDSPPVKLNTSFFSLYGRHGALPWHYTKKLISEKREYKKEGMRSFLDIFNHRLISLFYRAGVKYRVPRNYRSNKDNLLYKNISALAGFGTRELAGKLKIEDSRLFKYASTFQQPRSSASLEMMISDLFDVKVEIKQFRGEWVKIEKESQCRIGINFFNNNKLGQNMTVGKRTWSVQHKFRINLGPMDYTKYLELSPSSEGYKKLMDTVKFFCGNTLTFDMKYSVKKNTLPGFILNSGKCQLGRSLWLCRPEYSGEKDLVVNKHAPVEVQ